MDGASIQLGLTAAGLASTFFSKSVEEIGKTVADSGIKHLSSLVDIIRKRFKQDRSVNDALVQLEVSPTDAEAQRVVAEKIEQSASNDEQFRNELLELIRMIAQTKHEFHFTNEVRGNLEKLIQIDTNYGSITIM